MSMTTPISAETQAKWHEFASKQVLAGVVTAKEQSLLSLWEQSLFSARLCQKYPQWLDELVQISAETNKGNEEFFNNKVNSVVAELEQEDLFKQKLREVRHQSLLHICWKDLVLQADVFSLLEELSFLADACVAASADWLRNILIAKYGVPRSAEGEVVHLVVIAMGKLGGKELNFSSDIDIMFCYSNSGNTDGRRSISNQEFFTQLTQGIIRVLSDVTADGFVYRVDCRLRPFGDSGPLVVNFNHVEDYLHSHGREWERYAFIKARVIYGSGQDRKLLDKMVLSFVYRKYIDCGVVNTLREMKDLIIQQMNKKGNAENIKLGVGGIREIEFIVQFFQLVHGGRNPQLQTRRIIKGFAEIASAGYLIAEDVERISLAYQFLRRVENRLQMRNDEQTYTLPVQDKALQVLAGSMNYSSIGEFKRVLQGHLDAVSAVSAQILSNDQEQAAEDIYSDAWSKLTALDESETAQALHIDGYKDFEHVCEKLLQLIRSSTYKSQDRESRRRLKVFIPCFLRQLREVDSPALVIDRLYLLLHNILRRSAYMVLLYENQEVLKQLLMVISSSSWIASHLTSYPLLLDELVISSQGDYLSSKDEVEEQFLNEVLRHTQLEYEAILERVRSFKHARELRVACADVQNKIPIMKVSDQLSWTAEVLVDGCVKYLEQAYDPAMMGNLAVIAFGKLGGIELSYGSDLDLVYISKNEKDSNYPSDAKIPYAVKISKFSQRLTQILTLQTVSGNLYEVDTRLRPDGESGAMVPSFSFVQNYYQSSAWTWELQALVRARCVAGTTDVRQLFSAMREQILCQARDKKKLAAEVIEMRAKMLETKRSKVAGVFDLKNDEGGITDIEFMVQYAVLAYAHKDNTLCAFSDNVRLLEGLASGGFISSSMAAEITDIYCQFRNIMHRMALQSQKTEVTDGEYETERKMVQDCWNKILSE